jgi:two-component system chemotaxis response regulator CheY
MRNYLSAIVRDFHFDTEQAEDGQDALDCLAGKDFDLALVDWDMPRMDGISFVQAVRAEPRFDLMKPVTAAMLSEKLKLLGLLD